MEGEGSSLEKMGWGEKALIFGSSVAILDTGEATGHHRTFFNIAVAGNSACGPMELRGDDDQIEGKPAGIFG